MPEKIVYVAIFVNLSGITFIFEFKYLPKYEKEEVPTKLLLYFQIIWKCHVILNFFVTLGTHDTGLHEPHQMAGRGKDMCQVARASYAE